MTAEFRRLGKPGAYRLGQLRAQGIAGQRQPKPFRPRFARSRQHGWPAWVWLLGLLAGGVAMAAATIVGWWFAPLLAGAGAGIANRAGGWPPRVALPALVAIGVVGWGVPLWLGAGRAEPFVAVPRVLTALTGLPGYAAAAIALTLLMAVLQALTGYWLARALTHRLPDDLFRRG